MMDRLYKISGAGLFYLATSILFAQIILFAYLAHAWRIDWNKLNLMIAIAQGFDLFQSEEILRRQVEDKIQQMSFDEVLRLRAERRLEGDYQQMRGGQVEDSIMLEVRRLEDRKKRVDEIVLNFEQKIADLEEQAKSRGFNDMRAMIESLQPELAKRQIVKMIESKETDRVVLLLRSMEETPRKKLLNVMRKDEEIEDLADILRRVGDGEPESRIAEEMRQQLP